MSNETMRALNRIESFIRECEVDDADNEQNRLVSSLLQECHFTIRPALEQAAHAQSTEAVAYAVIDEDEIIEVQERQSEAHYLADQEGGIVVPLYGNTHPPAREQVPSGWQLVPVELTKSMRVAFHKKHEDFEGGQEETGSPDDEWKAMLAAAPQPPAQGCTVKESILKAVDDEPELPDEMPEEMWQQMFRDKATATVFMRITVRETKRGIRERIDRITRLESSEGTNHE